MLTKKRTLIFLIVCLIIPIFSSRILVTAGEDNYTWPVNTNYSITATMYYSSGKYHGGVDFACPVGSPVYSIASGTVITVTDRGCLGTHINNSIPKCSLNNQCLAVKNTGKSHGSYGNWIVIDHGNNVYSWYCHLSTGTMTVKVGQQVEQGQVIALSGNAGNSSGPHLHHELRIGGNNEKYRVDPLKYLTKKNTIPSPTPSITETPIKSHLIDPLIYNADYYRTMNPDLEKAFGNDDNALLNHWLNIGVNEGRIASPVFWSKYYVNLYNDLKTVFGTNYEDAILHFLNNGINEHRQGNSEFNLDIYKANYKDLQENIGNNNYQYYLHYIIYGKIEGRIANYRIVIKFDANGGSCDTSYMEVTQGNPYGELPIPNKLGYIFNGWFTKDEIQITADSIATFGNDITLYAHWTESPFINPIVYNKDYYRAMNPDLEKEFGNDEIALLNHWLSKGINEGRISSPVLHISEYVERHIDLKNVFGTDYKAAIIHFLTKGVEEGRVGYKEFDFNIYKANYKDLQENFSNNNYEYFLHYVNCGMKEGRIANSRIAMEKINIYE